MFGLFKKNSAKNLDNVIVGFLRTRQNQLLGVLGIGIHDKKYKDVFPSKETIIKDLIPVVNRKIFVELNETLHSINSRRIQEIVGEFSILLQLRINAAEILAANGTIDSEEIKSPDTLAKTLNEEIVNLIARSKELKI
jgi:hypothetical protein